MAIREPEGERSRDPSTPSMRYSTRQGQSFAGFVRANLARVEYEQRVGMSLEHILADIHAQAGFDTATLKSFKTALLRARRRLDRIRLPAGAVLRAAEHPAMATQEAPRAHTQEVSLPRAAPQEPAAAPPSNRGYSVFSYQPAREDELEHILGRSARKRGEQAA